MLDEIREYGLYTCPIDESLFEEGGSHRLRWHTFVENGWSGLPRAMEVIARKRLFAEGDGSWPSPERMQEAEEELSRWVAWADEPSQAEGIDCWVQRYLQAFCNVRCKTKSARNSVMKDWRARSEQGFAGMLFDPEEQWRDDRNRTTFQRVIANALRQGPLQVRYLAGNERAIDGIESDARKLDKRSRKYVYALTALFMLADGYERDGGVISVSWDALFGWLEVDRKTPPTDAAAKWTYAGAPLFETESSRTGDLWHISEQWLDDGGWRIVSADDGDALALAYNEIENCAFFGDGPEGRVAIPGVADGAPLHCIRA